MQAHRRGDPASPAARSRCCRSLGLPRSTSRSSTSCSTGSCSPPRGTSCRGYSGYFSFGHGAFFGAGMYTTAALAGKLRLAVPLDAAARGAGRRAARRRARRGRVPRQARARRAVRAADAGVHVRRRHHRPQHADRRRARASTCSAVAVPKLGPSPPSHVLPAGARRGARDAVDRVRDLPLAARHGPVRHPRRRGRRRGDGRADLPLQARRIRDLVRARRPRRRHPRACSSRTSPSAKRSPITCRSTSC